MIAPGSTGAPAGTWRELTVLDADHQTFEAVLKGRSCLFALRWSAFSARWSFDLAVDGVIVLQGRRLVLGVDLLAPFDLGLGRLLCLDWEGRGVADWRQDLPAGRVRLLHHDPDDLEGDP